jgi:hypothetical protein
VTGTAWLEAVNGATATYASGDQSATIDSGSFTPASSAFFPVTMRGHFYTGGSAATGNLDIQYRNNRRRSTHTIGKGSVLRYRAL